MSQEPAWVTESSAVRHNRDSLGSLVVGAVMAYVLRDSQGLGSGEGRAGFWLGVLLCGIGLYSLLIGDRQRVTVDPKYRVIVLTQRSRWKNSSRVVRFAEVAGASVGTTGDRSDGPLSYHVNLRLKGGEVLPLFLSFFEGEHDEAVATQRCQRLLGLVRLAA